MSENDINEIIISTKRNNINLIYDKNRSLDFHINEKMKIYDQDFSNTKLFVNVGGGVSSVGWYPGIKKITGFLSVDSLNVLTNKKLIHDCIMTRFSNRPDNPIPSLNIIDIEINFISLLIILIINDIFLFTWCYYILISVFQNHLILIL